MKTLLKKFEEKQPEIVFVSILSVFSLMSCNKKAEDLSCSNNRVEDSEVNFDKASIYSVEDIHNLIIHSPSQEKIDG